MSMTAAGTIQMDIVTPNSDVPDDALCAVPGCDNDAVGDAAAYLPANYFAAPYTSAEDIYCEDHLAHGRN